MPRNRISGPAGGSSPASFVPASSEFSDEQTVLKKAVQSSDLSKVGDTIAGLTTKIGEHSMPLNVQEHSDLRQVLNSLQEVVAQAHDNQNHLLLVEIQSSLADLRDVSGNEPALSDAVDELRARIQTWEVDTDSLEIDTTGRGPLPTAITPDLALESLDNYLLYQQEIFRAPTTRLDGIIEPDRELAISDPSGRRVDIDAPFLKSTSLDKQFDLLPNGMLQLKASLMDKGTIDPKERHQISEGLLKLVRGGYEISLKNPAVGNRSSNLVLREVNGQLKQTVIHKRAASNTLLHFDRQAEIVPGSSPPISFDKALQELSNPDSDMDFDELNSLIHRAYEMEQHSGSVSDDMSFMQYKLQFISLDAPSLRENGLRWHDGDSHINAPEWAFLHLKASDLPEQDQHYYWTTITWKDPDGTAREEYNRIASPTKPPTKDDILKALAADGWFTGNLTIEVDDYSYSVPGKSEILPMMEAIPASTLRALMSGPDGNITIGKRNQRIDISKASDLTKLRQTAVSDLTQSVMGAAITSWSQHSGEAIASLLKDPIPDTQRIFLRQSNGTENAEGIGKFLVGQRSVVTDGNDTGAFGKCAPTSYFCGAMMGIATGARQGLNALQANPDTQEEATILEKLLTQVPMDAANRKEINSLLRSIKRDIGKDADLKAAHQNVDQLVTSVVDRMVPKFDAQGPYFEMAFRIPKSILADDYMANFNITLPKRNPLKVKVRPSDIQEYLEQTNRSDLYRGGKKHMMDFFKDPSSMNNIELMRTLGPGLVAVGVDKALKEVGKTSGLLFGPGPATVASMVYNRDMKEEYFEFKDPVKGDLGSSEYEKNFNERRDTILDMLSYASDNGGACAVTMGFELDNFHVNYLQTWGTPRLGGVEIASEDLARCHMNYFEDSASSSAWNNDRVQPYNINTQKMAEGLSAIQAQLMDAGLTEKATEIDALLEKANDATGMLERLAKKAKKKGIADLWANDGKWKSTMNRNPKYRNAVREAAADTMTWIKANLSLDHSDGMNKKNVSIMPSNTERDNSMSDNAGDRKRIGGGQIGDQTYGSSNASDATYFVPLNALAGGWDDINDDAGQYKNYGGDMDYFIFLSSMEIMYPK